MAEQMTELEMHQMELHTLREELGLNRKDFALEYGIPLRTIEDWEHGKRKMPPYLLRLLTYKVKMDALSKKAVEYTSADVSQNVNVVRDAEGKKVVLINDIRFKSRRTIDWNAIEKYLKEYIGSCFAIVESAEKIFIGTEFPDEFTRSNDTIRLKGANEKAKAKAKHGWYRYDTRFGIPVYDESGELLRYNIFSTRMLVRCDADGKLYLYDFVRTKKETSSPLEQ